MTGEFQSLSLIVIGHWKRNKVESLQADKLRKILRDYGFYKTILCIWMETVVVVPLDVLEFSEPCQYLQTICSDIIFEKYFFVTQWMVIFWCSVRLI